MHPYITPPTFVVVLLLQFCLSNHRTHTVQYSTSHIRTHVHVHTAYPTTRGTSYPAHRKRDPILIQSCRIIYPACSVRLDTQVGTIVATTRDRFINSITTITITTTCTNALGIHPRCIRPASSVSETRIIGKIRSHHLSPHTYITGDPG